MTNNAQLFFLSQRNEIKSEDLHQTLKKLAGKNLFGEAADCGKAVTNFRYGSPRPASRDFSSVPGIFL